MNFRTQIDFRSFKCSNKKIQLILSSSFLNYAEKTTGIAKLQINLSLGITNFKLS